MVYNRSKTVENDIKRDINCLVETLWMFSNNFHKQDIYAVALVPENTYFCVKKGPKIKFFDRLQTKNCILGLFGVDTNLDVPSPILIFHNYNIFTEYAPISLYVISTGEGVVISVIRNHYGPLIREGFYGSIRYSQGIVVS